MEPDEPALRKIVQKLSLETKVLLLTGRDMWSLHPIPEIGLRSLVVSDGPAGVRGRQWDEREPSVNFPSPTALCASWSRQIMGDIGRGLGAEARRKNVDVVLAPTINLHRSPYGGRHFEAFSEDPVLTAEMATAYARGVQEHGVGATLKHYVANEAETERFTASSDVDERTLRELYLLAFEKPVKEAPAWLVMSAYNAVNGTTASEHRLLTSPLKDEWGFDGVVVSDWTAVRSLESARAAQDLVMPGPDGPWGDALVAAVRSGDISESTVDDKVLRILRLAARVGALDGFPAPQRIALPAIEETVATARRAAIAGAVLLKNEGLLPLSSPSSIALIGEGAVHTRTQGGGSATVIPTDVVSPFAGIVEHFPDARVTWRRGAVIQVGLADIPAPQMRAPSGEHGMLARYLDASGQELGKELRTASRIVWSGEDSLALRATTVEFSLSFEKGSIPQRIGIAGVSDYRLLIDGQERATGSLRTKPGDDVGAAILSPPFDEHELPQDEGDLDVVVEFRPILGAVPGTIALGVGLPPARSDPEELIAEAKRAARDAELAIVVVSTSSEVESEGFDRTSLELPGAQDALVEAVLDANPKTIVVVNSGSPVLLPWRAQAAAILATWFPGQEFGSALASILSGAEEPGGRLPVTWPDSEEAVPVKNVVPTDGHLAYAEGLHIGHRAWLRAGQTPAYPFGHGQGYTTFELLSLETTGDVQADDLTARVRLKNTGNRKGKCVLQLYLEAPEGARDRPPRWLAAFSTVSIGADDEVELSLPIERRRFCRWQKGWQTIPGTFRLRAGFSVLDLPLETAVVVGSSSMETPKAL